VLLRAATLADLELLRHWDEQPHVVESDPNDDWHWEIELAREPDWREQLIAEVEGRPIGFVQIIDPAREESGYWSRDRDDVPPHLRAIDIWIGDERDLGRGFGTQMMRLAIARCFAPPDVTAILIDPLASNVRAHRFYERLGFRFVERRSFGEDDCRVYVLDRVDDLAARFRAAIVPHVEWTHRAHLTVGAWHVHHHGAEAALAELRAGIRALNDAHGTPNSATRGYHETITRAYVALLAEALAAFPAATPLAERVARVLAGPLAERDVLFRFWSRDLLMSPAARAAWIEPDVAPLGFATNSGRRSRAPR
jgi:aminoglycoside 6'-N-acetyltransferase